jgi:hypothetical protein
MSLQETFDDVWSELGYNANIEPEEPRMSAAEGLAAARATLNKIQERYGEHDQDEQAA